MGRSSSPREREVAVNVHRRGRTLIARVTGDLIVSTAEEFEAALRQSIEGRTVNLILDLGAVRFIDSAGMRSMIRLANESRGAGRKLRVRTASAPIQQAIEWGGLEHLLPRVA